MALADPYARQIALTGVAPVRSQVAVKSRTGGASQQYQRAQVETASPTRLVIMLYEGAIRFCQLAVDAMAVQDLATQHENLLKAQRIIAELLGSLNREKGTEIAGNLARLYTHMLEQLVVANLHDDPEPVALVQSMLRDLWASWIEVERLTEQGNTEGNREQGTGESQKTEDKRQKTENSQSPIQNPSRLGNINA